MRKQIVEINGKFYLRSLGFFEWVYLDKDYLLNSNRNCYWWPREYGYNSAFHTLEELENAIEEFPQKKKDMKKKNNVKVIKTLWFKKF